MKTKKNQSATSLIELTASIAIVSISLSAVVMSYFQVAKCPSIAAMNNALLIANNYLNEILSKSFPNSLPCPPPPNQRANYTNVCDYNNLINIGAKDYNGNQIDGLEKYNVFVTVDPSSNAKLGDLTGSTVANMAKVVKINLKVTNPGMPDFIISTYKGNY